MPAARWLTLAVAVMRCGAPSTTLAQSASDPAVEWSGLTQMWWQGAVPAVRDGQFAVVVARPLLRLKSRRVSLLLQPELAGSPRLLDSILSVRLSARHQLSFGRYRSPFTRTTIIGLPGMDVARRGVVDAALGFGRQRGVMTTSTSADQRWDVRLGLFDSSPISAGHARPLATGRAVYSPWGPAPETLIGGGSGLEDHRVGFGLNVAAEQDQLTAALEAIWAGPLATTTVSAYGRSTWGGDDIRLGAVARGSVVLMAPWLRFAARVEALRGGGVPMFVGTTAALDVTPLGPAFRTLLEVSRGQGGGVDAAAWTARMLVQGQL